MPEDAVSEFVFYLNSAAAPKAWYDEWHRRFCAAFSEFFNDIYLLSWKYLEDKNLVEVKYVFKQKEPLNPVVPFPDKLVSHVLYNYGKVTDMYYICTRYATDAK